MTRAINLPRVDKRLRRKECEIRLMALGPSKVYGGLLSYAIGRGWRPGWASFAFKEIFGDWPKDQHRRGPFQLSDFLIEEWVAHRKKSPRIKAKDAAPLLAEVEKPVVQVDASGNIVGTYMKPEDFEVEWR